MSGSAGLIGGRKIAERPSHAEECGSWALLTISAMIYPYVDSVSEITNPHHLIL